MPLITSRQNPVVKRFKEAAEAGDELLLDGPHLLAEALLAHLPVEVVAVENAAANGEIGALVRRAEEAGARVLDVSGSVLEAMSPVRRPTGIVAIAQRRESTVDQVLGDAPQMVLMLEHVQDPGNVGAIIRAADACGATGVAVGAGSADPFGWKALRGSMGSAFRLPHVAGLGLEEVLGRLRARGVEAIAAVNGSPARYDELDLRGPVAFLLGSEGSGLPAHVLPRLRQVSIPMRGAAESLNVGVAAGVLLFEAARQRRG